MKIKLIVNYKMQKWNGNNYDWIGSSIILTFENTDEISNKAINKILKSECGSAAFRILNINQIT